MPRLRGGSFLILAAHAAAMLVTAGPVAAQSLFDLSIRGAMVHYGRPATLPVSAAGAARAPTPRRDTRFLQQQLAHPRVAAARVETRFAMKQRFEQSGAVLGESAIFLRVFKRERELELWARSSATGRFVLVRSYAICALGTEPGPKRREGDRRTPEGFYQIDGFNPNSTYHLSLHIDYPNRSDRIRGAGGRRLGGEIYIHGDCVTAGCVAVTDDGISELYWAAVESHAAGQRSIPVHIFPFRLTPDAVTTAERVFAGDPALLRFWHSLVPGYRFFERTREVPQIRVDARGYYLLGSSLTAGVREAALDRKAGATYLVAGQAPAADDGSPAGPNPAR